MTSTNLAPRESKPIILTTQNYESWSTLLKEELIVEGLWNTVSGIGSNADENSNALRKIQKVSGDFAKFICQTDSAKDAWNYLRALHNQSKVIANKDYKEYLPLQRAIAKGDWKSAKAFLDQHPNTVTARITQAGDTPLIFAIRQGHLQTVKELVNKMDPKDLEIKNDYGVTALSLAAVGGTTEIAKVLVEKNRDLVRIKNVGGWVPLVTAAQFDKKDMVRYLYEVTPKEDLQLRNYFNGSMLVATLISIDMYDVSSRLVQWHGKLAITPSLPEETALGQLAERPSAFLSGSQMGFVARCVYQCVTVKSETICCTAPSCVKVDEEDEDNSPCNSGDQVGYRGPGKLHVLLSWFASNLLAIVRVDQIYREKLMHHQAHQLLRLLCNQVITFDYSEHEEFHVRSAIFKAAQCGTVEFIIEIANSCPNLIRIIDQHDQNIFHVAVKHRQEKIFNLIYKLGAEKANMACQTDDKGNHILHLAALLAPPERLRRVSGAALQLQRELQWFKEVEYITPPSHRNLKNAGGQIPHVLFRKQHKDLVEEGEKWMKDTATSSTVVATLIATVMFSAAFQVPGGNDDKGVPNFLHSRSFMLFAIADAFSLFSSITSALMFLYILTSRYAQEDFLRSLPEKLIIGLVFLFLSMLTMMMSFGAALFIMLRHEVVWITIPICLLVGVPVTLFAMLQFPLFVDMIKSTYGSGVFIKDTKPFYKKPFYA